MADSKITALTALTAADPVNDVFPIVDVSDTTMAASGTTKKISVNNILGASGTATLASATITGAATVGTTLGVTGNATLSGDLTVRTSKLFVNATGVGIGNAGPLSVLTVSSQTDARLSVRTTESVFGSITGGTAFDSLNDAATILVPFGCRGSTISFAASGQNIGLQLDASSNVNVPLGNVVIGTSGKGIDFSATASGSGTMTSELLADYEEGTFVPTQGSGLTVVGAFSSSGTYTKVGRLVTINGVVIGATSIAVAANSVLCAGLPFSATNQATATSVNGSFTASSFCAIDAANFYAITSMVATTSIRFTATYYV